MKRLVAAGIAIIAISLVIMSLQSRTASVNVSHTDFSEQGDSITEELKLSIWNDFIEVTLDSNPTTGFEWRITEVSYETSWVPFQQKFESPEWTPISHQFEPAGVNGTTGASGQEVWTFPAGTGNIAFEYSQPWEGGQKTERTFDLVVVSR
jgi:predicted secreted protein